MNKVTITVLVIVFAIFISACQPQVESADDQIVAAVAATVQAIEVENKPEPEETSIVENELSDLFEFTVATAEPTIEPTEAPTLAPTLAPTKTPRPTATPKPTKSKNDIQCLDDFVTISMMSAGNMESIAEASETGDLLVAMPVYKLGKIIFSELKTDVMAAPCEGDLEPIQADFFAALHLYELAMDDAIDLDFDSAIEKIEIATIGIDTLTEKMNNLNDKYEN